MKAVVDTNIVLSGLFFRGAPREVLDAWTKRVFVGIVTSEILEEYRRASMAFLGVESDPEIEEALRIIIAHSIVIGALPLPHAICRDADDDKFIACALHGRADCIVSGDKDLKALHGRIPVPILGAREFVGRLRRQ